MAVVIRRKRGELKERIVSFLLGRAVEENWTRATETYPALETELGISDRRLLYKNAEIITDTLRASRRQHDSVKLSNGHNGNGRVVPESPAEELLPEQAMFISQQSMLCEHLQQKLKLLTDVLQIGIENKGDEESLKAVVAAVLEYVRK